VGVLISLLLFVIFGLASTGATVPLEATPAFFGWLATVDPMHQVYLGTRALLYFDAQAKAGLSQAVALTAFGLAMGLLWGAVVTNTYDRRGYHRIPGRGPTSADEPETTDAPKAVTTPGGAHRQDDHGEQPMASAAKSGSKPEPDQSNPASSTVD
jgi:hypothetical protein